MTTLLEINTQRGGPYSAGLGKTEANYASLSPLSFLPKAAETYPNGIAIIHGEQRRTWAETYARCRRLASALHKRGIGSDDTVAVMAPNVPAIYEAHFGIPMIGAVLNTLNIRLDAEAIAFQLAHGEAKVLITDREFSGTIQRALQLMERRPLVIDIDDKLYAGGTLLGEKDYEAFLEEGDPDFAWSLPEDEWQAIALNYTSGTTGNPKGVVTHHRGAYLNALSNIVSWAMPAHAVYLWTLPMFHCNGWCFPWTMAAIAGTNVCIRRVDAKLVFEAIREDGVTHMCGAPIVYNMLINAAGESNGGVGRKVNGFIAGSAPPASVIEGHGAHRLRHHPRVWPDRNLRPGVGVRETRRMGIHVADRARPAERAPRRCRSGAGGDGSPRPGHDEAGAIGRRDRRRDHVPRQHHDEGLPEESLRHGRGFRRGLVPHRGPRGDRA